MNQVWKEIHTATLGMKLTSVTKPLNTQNEWRILTLIGAVAGFCLVSLDVKEKYTNQSLESRKHAKKSILLLLASS